MLIIYRLFLFLFAETFYMVTMVCSAALYEARCVARIALMILVYLYTQLARD